MSMPRTAAGEDEHFDDSSSTASLGDSRRRRCDPATLCTPSPASQGQLPTTDTDLDISRDSAIARAAPLRVTLARGGASSQVG